MRLKFITYCFFLVLFLLGCSKPILIDDIVLNKEGYFQFGRIPERSFYYPVDIGDSLTLKWTGSTNGSFSSTSVTAYDNFIFVPELSGRVYSFLMDTGKEKGREKEKGAVSVSPVIYRSRLFFLVNDYLEKYSTLYYYDFLTGKYISENHISGPCNNEMIKTEAGIYIVSDFGNFYKFNYLGQLDWHLDLKSPVRSNPAMSHNSIVLGTVKGEIIAVNVKDKKIEYRNKITERFESGLSISDSAAFIGDDSGTLFSINYLNGKVLWRFDTGASIRNTPIFNSENIFIGNLNGDLYSLNKNNGNKNWETNTGGLINATPLLFNDYIVQPDLLKKIYLIDVKTGDIEKTINLPARSRMSPVFFKNNLIFGIDKGKIFTYEINSLK